VGFNINEYEPVEDRLARFWTEFPDGRVLTELVHHSETQFIVRAAIYRTSGAEDFSPPWATGYAEERVDNNPKRVNFASALENCETSAIGRALANAGYATKGKRPSREEMAKVERSQARTVSQPTYLTILTASLKAQFASPEARKTFVDERLGRSVESVSEITKEEAEHLVELLAFENPETTTEKGK